MDATQEAVEMIEASGMSDPDKRRLCRLLRLLDKSSADMDGTELRQAREAAGLSVGQAAEVLGVARDDIEWMESGDRVYGGVDVDGPLSAERVDAAYGLGRRPERTRFA